MNSNKLINMIFSTAVRTAVSRLVRLLMRKIGFLTMTDKKTILQEKSSMSSTYMKIYKK